MAYYGQSFGGIYGTMLTGAEPRVRTAALNVPGGPIVDIARESAFRSRIADQLRANKPDLRNAGPGLNGFTESLPLRRDPRVTDPVPGSAAIREYAARGNWLERPGSPETFAAPIAAAIAAGSKKALYQTAYTDGTVPNPTAGVLYRAGNLYDKVWVYRNDRTPTVNSNPHGFLLDPTVAGRNQGQQQIADFLTSLGATVTDPDGPGPVWENSTQATVSTDYRAQLDCLHYPDPQTGATQSRTPNSPDCADRSNTVSKAQTAPSPAPSSTQSPAGPPATSTPSPGATASPGATPTGSPSATPSGLPAASEQLSYTALTSPQRVLDSRTGVGTAKGRKRGAVTLDLSGILPSGARAVALNVTVLNASARGFVVVHPGGSSQPPTSNVNVEASVPGVRANTQANEVVARVSTARTVTLTVDSTTADLVADLVGFFGAADQGGVGLDPVTPTRLLDSRNTSTPQRRGETVLDLTGTAAEGASSVALNVTVTRPSARGFVVAYPTGTTRPGTSNVNVEAGQTQANEVLVRVGAGNKVSLFVDSTSAVVIADLVGVVAPSGALFAPLPQPVRVADTRTGQGLPKGRLRGAAVLSLNDVVPSNARAVFLNVTATNGDRAGFVTVYPNGQPAPGTSNVNFPASLTQANEVLTGLGAQRDVRVVVGGANGPAAHVVVDVVGYLVGR